VSQQDQELALLGDVVRGRISRRDLLTRAAALGVSAPAFAGLLAALPQPAAAQDATPGGTPTGSITWALESAPPNVIPFGGIALAQWWGKEFMYDSLLMWDQDLIVQPALAESYETPDELTYVFHLRKGVRFHDGGEMTAKDVKYSLETSLNPREPGVKVPYVGNIASVEAVDDYTVKVTMAKADPTLPGTLAWTHYTPIVPEGLLDRINVLSEGIGTGPFKLKEFVQDDQIVYEAFPEHWQAGVPGVAALTLKVSTDEQARLAALRAGEIDGGTFTADVVRTIEGDDSLQILSGLTSAPRVIQFNTTKEVPWRDIRVRQAINKTVDRQEIIDKVYSGDAVLTGAIPPGYGDWPLTDEQVKAIYTVDVEGAKALMAEAGYADGFEVTLQAISAPREYTQIAEIVQQQLKQININVKVEPLEIGTFADNIGKGNFEWASTGRGMRGDPSGHVVDFRSGTANNLVWFGDGWKNDELDALYDEALTTVDQARRHELYNKIQELILTEVANLYTVVGMKYQVASTRVQGMYVFYGNTNPGLRTATVTE
jgi:peptide/nickel transport system substrate-binding protein